MFNIKPIITRREEKIIIKYLKSIDCWQKEYDAELKRRKKSNEPLGFSTPAYKTLDKISGQVEVLVEFLKAIYLDK